LARRQQELGLTPREDEEGEDAGLSDFSGGMTRLEGAAYFRFFAYLMLGTAMAFIPFSLWYQPRTQLQT
jgi:POT family proton-dependent oligopeptide transporter